MMNFIRLMFGFPHRGYPYHPRTCPSGHYYRSPDYTRGYCGEKVDDSYGY